MTKVNHTKQNDISAKNSFTLAKSNNRFAFKLFTLMAADKQENLVFSPYNLSLAFAMLYLGARESTLQEIAKVLTYTLPFEEVAPAFAELRDYLHEHVGKDNELLTSNALWISDSFDINPKYLMDAQHYYHAKAHTVDTNKDSDLIAGQINTWVAKNTKGKIPSIIDSDSINGLTALVLTNACYFNAKWKYSFKDSKNNNHPFYITPDQTISITMMDQVEQLPYYEDNTAQVIELPYQSSTFSFFVILPQPNHSLSTIISTLNHNSLTQYDIQIKPRMIKLCLPQFKIQYHSNNLKDLLQKLGIHKAFEGKSANFSGLTTKPHLYVSHITHKATIEIDQEGTTASAATAMSFDWLNFSPKPPPALEVKVNRPFFFLIKDNSTNSVLFLGQVINPYFEE